METLLAVSLLIHNQPTELKDVRLKQFWRLLLVIVITVLGVVSLDLDSRASSDPEEEWWPIQVKSYYGEYVVDSKQPGQAAKSLSRPRLEEWAPPLKHSRITFLV